MGEDLDGDDAFEDLMSGLEDLSHPATAEVVDDPVGAEVELGSALQKLLGLPGIQAAGLDQLLGQTLVAGESEIGGAGKLRLPDQGAGLVELIGRQQPTGHGATLED